MDMNEAVHATIVDLAESPMLRRTMQPAIADETLVMAKQHHRGIVDAIARRQGTRAESLAREHACIARRIFEISLSDSATLSRVPGALLIRRPVDRGTWPPDRARTPGPISPRSSVRVRL